MSRGKYSPVCPHANADYEFKYNCYGEIPVQLDKSLESSVVVYDEKTMFANYDAEGFDSYGYSAFDSDGNYVGIGRGIDRNGITENEYCSMSDEEFQNL